MSRRKPSSNLAMILARLNHSDGQFEGIFLLRVPKSVVLAIIAVVAKYLLG